MVGMAVGLFCCTDDEQQKMIDQRKQTEQKETQAPVAASPVPDAPIVEVTPEAVQTPEVPPEPEKVDNYRYGSTVCECRERTECGMTFWGCTDGRIYGCMHDATYSIVKVEKTEENDGNCSN
jgi:hypothetical protein